MRFAILSACLAALAITAPAAAQMGMPKPLPAEALVDQAEPDKAAWLTRNIVAEGSIAGGIAFRFPASFYRSKLILLGESHGFAAPQVVDLELLTHLNQRIGLTDYVAEVDPVQADLLNRYLVTGDDALLTRVFDFWTKSGAQWGNRAFEAKVRGIRALNQRLPEKRRIRLLGIDAIQDWALVAEWAANGDAEAAKRLAAAPKDDRARTLRAAIADRTGTVAGQLRATLDDAVAGKGRETIIFDSYARAVGGDLLGNRPAYGLWGMYHVMQAGINKTRPFAARVVASDLPAAKATTSVALLALDSAVQIPAPMPTGLRRLRMTNFNMDGPYVMVKGAATLRAASRPSTVRIFDLGAKGTPFTGSAFSEVATSVGQSFVPDATGADAPRMAQYLGVFTNSDWAAPREPQ
ncbi:hypothetical protein [uncultured Sphingomonas sp.]|uniref:hypothetical protein n=1 Tax=uncultured Sphingomonas sp. TaxID=158754 RepID=UPI0025D90E7B|nr:hypothetical protein [uncultured Sphingomonas sp.]